MKGLENIPNFRKLSLACTNPSPRIQDLALLSQWARLDPRLAEILIVRISSQWKTWNPLKLRDAILQQPWPSALGPLLEQACRYTAWKSREERKLFKTWSALVMCGIPKSSYQSYFIGLRSFGGKLTLEDAHSPLKSFSRWGYYSRDLLVNKASSLNRTVLSVQLRRQKLVELLRQKKQIMVSDYCRYLDGGVSRRQAQRDLASFKRVKHKGHTRSRFYYPGK